MAVTVRASTTLPATNVVEAPDGVLWVVAWSSVTQPLAYYSDDGGASWTLGTTLTAWADTAAGVQSGWPARLIATDNDEFVLIDGFRYAIYTRSGTSWTQAKYEQISSVGPNFGAYAAAWDVDADNFEVVFVVGYSTSGPDYITGSVQRFDRTASYARTQVAGAPVSYSDNNGPGGTSTVFAHADGDDYGDERPAKLLNVFMTYNGSVLYNLTTWNTTTLQWDRGGNQLAGSLSVGGSVSKRRPTHLVYNPRVGKALLTVGALHNAFNMWEYDFASDLWTSLAHPAAAAAQTFAPTTTVIGGSYDNDDNVHVVYEGAASGSSRKIIHDTWDRDTGTWTSEDITAAGADTASTFSHNRDSAYVNAHRYTYLIGGDLVYDAVKYNRAPDTPTLTQPAALEHRDLTADTTFSAVYTDPDGDPIDAYQFRIKQGAGSYAYWDGDSLEAAETWVTPASEIPSGGTIDVTIPGGTLTNGTTDSWSYRVRDPAGEESAWAADETYIGAVPPSITVDTPSDPVTGTDTRPATSITYTGANPKASHRILYIEAAVYTAAGFDIDTVDTADALWDSTVVASTSEGPITPTADVVDGRTYRAYWQVVDDIGATSQWAYAEFTVDLTPPSAAELSGTVDPDNSRMQLTATATHDTGAYPDATVTFQRLTDGGWVDVIGGVDRPFAAGEAVIVDEEIRTGASETWRAVVNWDNAAGSVLASDPSNLLEATVDAEFDWIKDIYEDQQIAVHISAFDVTDPGSDTVHTPINRPDAVVVSDTVRLEQGSVSFRTDTLAERDTLRSMLDRRYPLLLQLKPDDAGAGDVYWARFHGDRSRARVTIVPHGTQTLAQSFVRQPRPDPTTPPEGS